LSENFKSKDEREEEGADDDEEEVNNDGESKKTKKSQEELNSEKRRKVSIEELDKLRRKGENKVRFKIKYQNLELDQLIIGANIRPVNEVAVEDLMEKFHKNR
jgi:hypothetical protein